MSECVHVDLGNGQHALVRMARKRKREMCRYCDKPHTRLCDHELASGKTCDQKMCADHAQHLAGRDLCIEHRR